MRHLILILALFLAFAGCKSPKAVTTDSRIKEQKNIENNISLVDTSLLDQVVSKAMQKYFNKKLNININNKVYDTEKPADPETGKPPLKEETDISLSKETNELETDSTTIKTNESTRSELVDKSKNKSKFEGSEKKGFTFWEALELSVAASLFIGFVIFLIGKFK